MSSFPPIFRSRLGQWLQNAFHFSKLQTEATEFHLVGWSKDVKDVELVLTKKEFPGTPNNQNDPKWMFGETTISYVKIGNHPSETTIYKWLFGVPVPGWNYHFEHFDFQISLAQNLQNLNTCS